MRSLFLILIALIATSSVKSQLNHPPALIWSHCFGDGASNEWANGACMMADSSMLSVGMGGAYNLSQDGDAIYSGFGWGGLRSVCRLANNKIVLTGAVGGGPSFMSFQLLDSTTAQDTSIEFYNFMAYKTKQTKNGDLIMVGIDGYFGNKLTVMRTSVRGIVKWRKVYSAGGSLNDVCENADGTFIITGNTAYNTGIAQTNHGRSDFFVAKIDSLGNLIWSKCYGGKSDEYASTIVSNEDNTFYILGSTESFDGDVVGHHGNIDTVTVFGNNGDVWLIKIDSSGNLLTQKCFGTSKYDWGGTSMLPTKDKGLVILCSTVKYNDDDLAGVNLDTTKSYAWVFRIDSNMHIYWNKCVGGISRGNGSVLIRDLDSNYLVCGMAASNGRDVSDWHVGNIGSSTNDDMWVFKLAKDTVCPIVLPIEIQHFDAQKQDKTVLLSWKTASITNSSHFNILRSEDAIHFMSIGQVKSNPAPSNYTYSDNHLNPSKDHQTIYYQLEMVNTDQSKDYSTIKKVIINSATQITIYPNPTKGILNIEGKDIQQIIIKDINGNTIEKFSNITTKQINLTKFSKGNYFIQVKTKDAILTKQLLIE